MIAVVVVAAVAVAGVVVVVVVAVVVVVVVLVVVVAAVGSSSGSSICQMGAHGGVAGVGQGLLIGVAHPVGGVEPNASSYRSNSKKTRINL